MRGLRRLADPARSLLTAMRATRVMRMSDGESHRVEERMEARIRKERWRAARSEVDGRVWTLVFVPVRYFSVFCFASVESVNVHRVSLLLQICLLV